MCPAIYLLFAFFPVLQQQQQVKQDKMSCVLSLLEECLSSRKHCSVASWDSMHKPSDRQSRSCDGVSLKAPVKLCTSNQFCIMSSFRESRDAKTDCSECSTESEKHVTCNQRTEKPSCYAIWVRLILFQLKKRAVCSKPTFSYIQYKKTGNKILIVYIIWHNA